MADDERLVCEQEARTGTLIKKKQCRTAAEVREDSANAERNANAVRQYPSQLPGQTDRIGR